MAPLKLKRKRLLNLLLIILLCYLVSLLNHHFRTQIDNSFEGGIKPQVRSIWVIIIKNIKNIFFIKKNNELSSLIKLVFQLNAFLIEIPVLKDIKNNNNVESIDKIFEKYYLNHSASKQIITFGIFNETLKHRHILENFERKVTIGMFLKN
jgi:hypothetical protein